MGCDSGAVGCALSGVSMISIIVPTFNEAQNVPLLVTRINKVLKGKKFEIVIVDDNSPDGTFEKAQALAKKHVHAVKRVHERGLATAVIEGFRRAKGDIFVVMDGDLQHPPESIPKLVKSIEKGADISIGSRYNIPGGGVEEDWSLMRKLLSRASALFVRGFVPELRKIRDPLTGFFAVRKGVVKNAKLSPIGFKILAEILVKGNYEKVEEVPFVFGTRKFGKSHLNLKEEMNFIRHNVQLRLYRR